MNVSYLIILEGASIPYCNAEIVMKSSILVSHDLDNKRAWTTCLSVKGVTLPTGYYFGASAITGNR